MFYQTAIISGLNPVLVGAVAYIGAAIFNNSAVGIPLGFGVVLLGIAASMYFTRQKNFGVWSSNRVSNVDADGVAAAPSNHDNQKGLGDLEEGLAMPGYYRTDVPAEVWSDDENENQEECGSFLR